MIYVMSDIHGQYQKYLKMLEKIDLKDEDELFILGDVVDRGPGSVKILKDMSMRTNVFPILGNHDIIAATVLKKLCVEVTEENYATHLTPELMEIYSMWQLDGGKETLDEFKKLSADEQAAIIDYLDEFMPYDILKVGENRFILVHGGIPYDKRDISLSEQSVYSLVSERPDYSKRYYKSAYLVTGHPPTLNIGEEYSGKIYRKNRHIAIDCGAGYGMPLGCIRLDDLEEFYVKL